MLITYRDCSWYTMFEMWYKRFVPFKVEPSNRYYLQDDATDDTKFRSDDTRKSMLEILIPAYSMTNHL